MSLKPHDMIVFDLDDTIYQTRKYGVYDNLSYNMFSYISKLLSVSYEEGKQISERYQKMYGTTAAGLRHEHGLDPKHFLSVAYDLNFDNVEEDVDLYDRLSRISNRKIVFTNAPEEYAESLLSRMGVHDFFSGVFGIHKSNYVCKPKVESFNSFLNEYGLKSLENVWFVDDREDTLDVAKDLGARTLLCKEAYLSYKHSTYKNIYDVLDYLIERAAPTS